MADAMEAIREDMDEKAADELIGIKVHDLSLVALFDAVVIPAERHCAGVSADQSAIRDRHAMSISAEIGEHGLWPTERRFCIDNPVDLAERRQPFGEGSRVSQAPELTKEVQFASAMEGG